MMPVEPLEVGSRCLRKSACSWKIVCACAVVVFSSKERVTVTPATWGDRCLGILVVT